MSSREEQKLDELTRRVIKEAGLEEPSVDIKLNIMAAVKRQSSGARFKALISNKSKVIVAVMAIAIIVLASFIPNKDMLLDGTFQKISSYFKTFSSHLPETFLYGIIAFGGFVILQVTIIKSYLDRQ